MPQQISTRARACSACARQQYLKQRKHCASAEPAHPVQDCLFQHPQGLHTTHHLKRKSVVQEEIQLTITATNMFPPDEYIRNRPLPSQIPQGILNVSSLSWTEKHFPLMRPARLHTPPNLQIKMSRKFESFGVTFFVQLDYRAPGAYIRKELLHLLAKRAIRLTGTHTESTRSGFKT